MLPATLVVLGLLLPTQATASVLAVQQDCADSDVFEQKHSTGDLKDTLAEIPADLTEYGTCRQMILATLAKRKSDNGPKDPGSPSGPAADLDGDGVVTPEEKAVVAKKAKDRQEQRNKEIAQVSDELVQDDAAAVAADGDSGGTSLPLILTIVALLCAGIGGGLWYAAKRNPAVANALRRVSPPYSSS